MLEKKMIYNEKIIVKKSYSLPVDETVSTLHVKPFDHARHFGS